MEFYENRQAPERALLVGVDTGEYDCDASLAELEELASTAGAEVAGVLSQSSKTRTPQPISAAADFAKSKTFVSKTKLIC